MNKRREDTKTCHQQMPGAAMVHPDQNEVFPLAPAPTRNDDGTPKRCELVMETGNH